MTTLLPSEFSQLADCEHIISKGISNFISVGNALLRIRDAKLYRATHATFASYCKEKWSMGKSRAYQIIEAAQVVGVLPVKASEMSTIVDKPLPAPTCEATVRPLTQLEPSEQPAAYARAVEMANGEAPTAKQVQAAVEEVKPKRDEFANAMGFSTTEDATEAVKEAETTKPALGMRYAKEAVKLLASIQKNDKQRREALDHVLAWIENQ